MTAALERQIRVLMHERDRNSFDIIRLFAACCVFVSHEIGMAGYEEPLLGPSSISLSSTGLYIFFALSGYLVYKSLSRNADRLRFFAARLLRIYPGSLANVLFCLLVGALVSDQPMSTFWGNTTWSYLVHNGSIIWTPTKLALPGVFVDARWPVVNGSVWTIKYELLCYLFLWFLCGSLFRRTPSRQIALLIATVALILAYIYRTSFYKPPGGDLFFVQFNAFNLIRFFMVFCAGATYAANEPHGERKRLLFFVIPAGLVIFGPTQAFAKCGVILLLTLFVLEIGRTPALYSRSYRKVGDLSYGIFLYAYPVQNLITTRFYDGHNLVAVTLGAFAIILLCAYVSWRLIERPALALKREIDRLRPSPNPVPGSQPAGD